jgi:hypothetical protein
MTDRAAGGQGLPRLWLLRGTQTPGHYDSDRWPQDAPSWQNARSFFAASTANGRLRTPISPRCSFTGRPCRTPSIGFNCGDRVRSRPSKAAPRSRTRMPIAWINGLSAAATFSRALAGLAITGALADAAWSGWLTARRSLLPTGGTLARSLTLFAQRHFSRSIGSGPPAVSLQR